MEILYSTATTISSGAMTLINIFSEFIVAKLQFLVKPPSYDLLCNSRIRSTVPSLGRNLQLSCFGLRGKWHNGLC